jgi:hypothetical protein
MARKKTESRTSPKGGKRGCLCDNGTYSSECCDGTLQNQGIGNTTQQGESVKISNRNERTNTYARG